ncbi:hypothetical protein LOD99_14335 [Oopsacas minuta]|uniref:ETS domain-containing protein n=1 Tax=Oopsacas minuta TaxID=111878 RepID=A0AAV7KHE1_9METZ|nr:hypothetical protein LOD99_14335 [Oopsacas minuta]
MNNYPDIQSLWEERDELDSYLPSFTNQYDYDCLYLDDWEKDYSYNLLADLDLLFNQTMEETSPIQAKESNTNTFAKEAKIEDKKQGKSRRKVLTLIKQQYQFSGQRYLLLFTLERLSDPSNSDVVWVKEEEGVFEIRSQHKFAREWGAHKERKGMKEMTYEKVARSLRYYYNCDIIDKVPGVRRYKWNLDVLEDLKSCSNKH